MKLKMKNSNEKESLVSVVFFKRKPRWLFQKEKIIS